MTIIPYLEVEITDHCNLRCAHCTHHSPYMDPGFYPLDEFRRDVSNLSKAARVQTSIRVMGGEPLLNQQVTEYVRALKESNLSERVGLCTNGILLDHALQHSLELFSLLDFMDVLIYPTPFQERVMANISMVRLAYPNLELHPMSPGNFWYEDFASRIPDGKVVDQIWQDCGMKNCNAIYQGRFVRCVQTYRKPRFLAKVGVPAIDQDAFSGLVDWTRDFRDGGDSVSLSSPTLADDLREFLARKTCLEACNWCLGQSGKDVPHAQRERGFAPPLFDSAMLKSADGRAR